MEKTGRGYAEKLINALAKRLNIDISKYSMDEMLMGMAVELEHGSQNQETDVTGDDPEQTFKIMLVHLDEVKDYYTKLLKYVDPKEKSDENSKDKENSEDKEKIEEDKKEQLSEMELRQAKVGDTLRHIRTGIEFVVDKIQGNEVFGKVTKESPNTPGIKLGSINKTNKNLIGMNYEFVNNLTEDDDYGLNKLRSVKVTYGNGDVISTNMAAHITDDQIKDYFKIGKKFNLGNAAVKGDGSYGDNMQPVAKVEILRENMVLSVDKIVEKINNLSIEDVIKKLNYLNYDPDTLPEQYKMSKWNDRIMFDAEKGKWVDGESVEPQKTGFELQESAMSKRFKELCGIKENESKKQLTNEAFQEKKQLLTEKISEEDFDIQEFENDGVGKDGKNKELYQIGKYQKGTLNENVQTILWPAFKEWEETAEVEEQHTISRTTDRSIYSLPDGTKVLDHYVMPGNSFQPSYGYTIVDLSVKANDENKALLSKYGGTIDEKFGYTENGYGLPHFKGDDSMEKAYNFVKNEKDKIVNDFIEQPLNENKEPKKLPDDIQKLVDDGKVTYRGCGPNSDDAKIKVHDKEYRISHEEFEKLGGIKKMKFSAPYRKLTEHFASAENHGKDPRLDDISRGDLDNYEQRLYDEYKKHGHGYALQLIINQVEGDYSQLSPKLAAVAEEQDKE